jgi:hypothetical protein
MPKIYELTDADRQIFHKARLDGGDARYFTDYFMNGWLLDFNIDPPWQLEAHHAPQTELTVIGGFGSGKTVAFGISYLIRCATIPYYKFLNVAPVAWQSRQMFDPIVQIIENTKLKEWFVDMGGKIIERPYPQIHLCNSYIGNSKMEFMSADKQGVKILAWEGDAAHIDEAGLLEDLESTVRNLGTRLRGTLRHQDLFTGETVIRAREGRLSMTSNAWEAPYMWWRVEQGDVFPEDYYGKIISTYSNKNLTPKQIKGFERKITTDEDRARWLEGKRPAGIGDQFSTEMIDNCEDEGLNVIMEAARGENQKGFHVETAEKCGINIWEMPADEGRVYCVIGDPGQGNPPYRNAPCIGVWDFTDFPEKPAVLRAFWWGFGRGSYQPFVGTMYRYMDKYESTDGAFDATGTQKMMDELVFERDNQLIQGMNMTTYKHVFNTALKLFMDKGLIRFPYIPSMRSQLGNYSLPDTKIPQDIVAMMQMTAGYLRNFYYMAKGGEDEEDEIDDWEMDPQHRRYARQEGERYSRRTSRARP